jgi:hypothetical protein
MARNSVRAVAADDVDTGVTGSSQVRTCLLDQVRFDIDRDTLDEHGL